MLLGEGEAPNLFYVDPQSGEGTLRESVLNSQATIYRVRNLITSQVVAYIYILWRVILLIL